MGYDVAILAVLDLPADQVSSWKRRRADATSREDWPQPLYALDAPPATVARVLAELPKQPVPVWSLREQGGRVELTAVVPEHVFTEQTARLITAFARAAELGGKARIDCVGFWTDSLAFGYRITPGETTLHYYSEAGRVSLERSAPYRWLNRRMEGADGPAPNFAKNWLKKRPEELPPPEATPPETDPAQSAGNGYDTIVSGQLLFGKKRDMQRWNGTIITAADVSATPFGAYAGPFDRLEVALLRNEIQYMEPSVAALRSFVDPPSAWVKGAIPAAALDTWGPLLLAAWQAATQHEAKGHLWFLSADETEHRGFIVDVAPNQFQIRDAESQDRPRAKSDELHCSATQIFGYYL